MKGVPAALLAAVLVGGCTPATPVAGLRPEHPVPDMMNFVKVASRRPTLRWEAFPKPEDRQSDARLAAVRDVSYDLRIWRAGPDDYPIDLVYAKDGLSESRHTLEMDLQPDTRYLWTVRARFNLNQRTLVTPWSTLSSPVDVARGAAIPDFGYFRFRTPMR